MWGGREQSIDKGDYGIHHSPAIKEKKMDKTLPVFLQFPTRVRSCTLQQKGGRQSIGQ
jgi:hypothetical protein